MQTRGVFPELAAPFTTPATPPVDPPLSALQQALVDKDEQIRILQLDKEALEQKCANLAAHLFTLTAKPPQA